MGRPVAVCVVYLAVNNKYREENVQLRTVFAKDARQWVTHRKLDHPGRLQWAPDLGRAGFKKEVAAERATGKYLPSSAVGKVCEDFEGRRSDEARKNAWWDEVEIAWKERRRANREHRQALKTGTAEVTSLRWPQYIELKHKVQALVQAKLAEHNMRLFQSMHSDGKSTAQRFWRYVSLLDRPAPPLGQLMDAISGHPILDLQAHLTHHFTQVFGDPSPPADLCGEQEEDISPSTTPGEPTPVPPSFKPLP
ncbi:hypothetical protein HPB48_009930 [Haemaphysalis longicornis]|uniref:Uncharacterized protein n=1 Tax=Haemaphysalis longicornis TaxID=44386 RepID=A0A9J6GS95_HAELO|nr:hypothetical protein HPB48_009930 [Haemaphysalis longicornis]